MNQPRSAKHKHKNAKRSSPETDSPILWVKHLGESVTITLGIGSAMLFLFSLGIYFCPDPTLYIAPLGLFSSALTALLGGFITVRIHGHSALLCGLFHGGLLTFVTLLIALFFKSGVSGYSAGTVCLLHSISILLSVAGAYIGLLMSEKRKKHRR